jgi:hypothetical protein
VEKVKRTELQRWIFEHNSGITKLAQEVKLARMTVLKASHDKPIRAKNAQKISSITGIPIEKFAIL